MIALAFALTGSDGGQVKVVDRAKCDVLIHWKEKDGQVVGDLFHLNAVELDRVTVQQKQDLTSQFIEVGLHGSTAVYEYTDDYAGADNPDKTEFLVSKLQKPRMASDYTLRFYTTLEKDRMVRAWNYIYSHGCTGAKQPF